MRVLLLSPYPELIRGPVLATGDSIVEFDGPPEAIDSPADLIVSYGYRYILRRAFLEKLSRPPVNLHISYLPWNRGSDPNFWSWIDDTPKGVSIHEIDEGLDTGDLIAQDHVSFDSSDTLQTSYRKLRLAVEALFEQHWPSIRAGTYTPKKQVGAGSAHRAADKAIYPLPLGYDTPVTGLQEWAADIRRRR